MEAQLERSSSTSGRSPSRHDEPPLEQHRGDPESGRGSDTSQKPAGGAKTCRETPSGDEGGSDNENRSGQRGPAAQDGAGRQRGGERQASRQSIGGTDGAQQQHQRSSSTEEEKREEKGKRGEHKRNQNLKYLGVWFDTIWGWKTQRHKTETALKQELQYIREASIPLEVAIYCTNTKVIPKIAYPLQVAGRLARNRVH